MNAFSLFLIGTSGSGKTTLASVLKKQMLKRKVALQVLDGDELRGELGNLFGYTKDERMKQSHVVRTIAKYLNNNGTNVIAAVVAPYEEMRQGFREYLGESYIEVYIKCSKEECARRDVKGYYAKIRNGEMHNLNGWDDVYEEPKCCDLIVDSEKDSVEVAANKIFAMLESKNFF